MVEISRPALVEATEALERSLASALGIRPRGNIARVAEHTVTAYLRARAENTRQNRMKAETVALMHMDIGDEIVIWAKCKQNIHGQFKSIRLKMQNQDMKWRIVEEKPFHWRVRRLPDDGNIQHKPAEWNPKAKFLAALPLGGDYEIYPGLKKAHEIIAGNHKNKAREILGDLNAEWRSLRVPEGIAVKRIR